VKTSPGILKGRKELDKGQKKKKILCILILVHRQGGWKGKKGPGTVLLAF
jgi:hypothetical protein